LLFGSRLNETIAIVYSRAWGNDGFHEKTPLARGSCERGSLGQESAAGAALTNDISDSRIVNMERWPGWRVSRAGGSTV
jgi:hypothetical protein